MELHRDHSCDWGGVHYYCEALGLFNWKCNERALKIVARRYLIVLDKCGDNSVVAIKVQVLDIWLITYNNVLNEHSELACEFIVGKVIDGQHERQSSSSCIRYWGNTFGILKRCDNNEGLNSISWKISWWFWDIYNKLTWNRRVSELRCVIWRW